jgi:hypothetical protein
VPHTFHTASLILLIPASPIGTSGPSSGAAIACAASRGTVSTEHDFAASTSNGTKPFGTVGAAPAAGAVSARTPRSPATTNTGMPSASASRIVSTCGAMGEGATGWARNSR